MSTLELAPNSSLASLLFRDAISRADHLVAETQTLVDYEYRSPTPPRIARLFLRVAKLCKSKVEKEWREYEQTQNDEHRSLLLKDVQVWDALSRDTGKRLRYLFGAGAARVPGGLSRLLETIIQDLDLGQGVLLREKWSYNYSIDFTPIEQEYRERLSESLSEEELQSLLDESERPPPTNSPSRHWRSLGPG